MGLFKIRKREFDANTQKAVNRIYTLSASAKDADMKAKFDCIRAELGKSKYVPSANRKEVKAIEARMFGALDNISRFVQKGSDIEIYGYCDILLGIINHARAFGKETLSASEIVVEEQMMRSKAEMEKMYAVLDTVDAQIATLVEKGKTANGVAKQRLVDEFAVSKNKRATYEANLEEMRKVYNGNCEILNRRERGVIYENIHRVASLKQFQDEMHVSMKRKLEFDKENAGFQAEFEKFDSLMNVETSANNYAAEFDSEVATAQKIDAFESAGKATPKVESVVDEFERLISADNSGK